MQEWFVPIFQAAALALGVISLLGLAVRRRLRDAHTLDILLGVLVRLGLLANFVPLAAGFGGLLGNPGSLPGFCQQLGGVVGAAALLLGIPAYFLYARGRFPSEGPLMLGSAVLGVCVALACVVGARVEQPWLGFHCLIGLWCLVAATWLPWAPTGSRVPLVVAGLVLLLGVRGMAEDPGRPWWPAGTVLGVAFLAWARALWRRQQGWMLAAGLMLHLAVSFLLADAHRRIGLEYFWVRLIQANVLAAAGVAVVWLMAFRPEPLLAVEMGVGLAGNTVLMVVSAWLLIASPGAVADQVRTIGDGWGWVALLASLAAAAWYAGQVGLAVGVPALCGAGLAVGVLLASTATYWDRGLWLPYHVLTVTWAAVAVGIMAFGSRAGRPEETDERHPAGAALVCGVLVGGLVLGLALRGATEDPLAPMGWSCAALLFVASLATDLALGRRREVWAFIAGLPLVLAACLLLWHRLPLYRGRSWDWTEDGILLAQVALIAGGIVAGLWIVVRGWLYGTDHPRPLAAPLLGLQVAILVASSLALLGQALAALVRTPEHVSLLVFLQGSIIGWAAFLAVAVPAGWYAHRVLRRSGAAVGCSIGLGAGVLLACSAARWRTQGWFAFHTLLASWAAVGLGVLVGTWRSRQPVEREKVAPAADGSAAGVAVAAILVAGLAVWEAVVHPDGSAWSVAAAAAITLQAAAVAVRRRSGAWAFAATLGVNLAVSLALGIAEPARLRELGWVGLLQANVIASAAGTLAWLTAGRHLHAAAGTAGRWRTAPVVLGLLGNLALLIPPAVLLVWAPEVSVNLLTQVGRAEGWIALLVVLLAAGWHAERSRAPGSIHELGILGIALGILAACSTAAAWQDGWLAYHVLLGSWAVAGLAVLAGSRRTGGSTLAHTPPGQVHGWLAIYGALVAALALRALATDPTGPWVSAAGLVVAALFSAALALGTGRQSFVWTGGLLLVGVAVAFGLAADVHLSPDWIALNLLGQALAAALCSAAETLVRRRWPWRLPRGDALPFAHVAILLSLLGVVGLGLLSAVASFTDLTVPPQGLLGWLALAAVVLALVVSLWDPDAGFSLAGLYAAGLAALGFAVAAVAPPGWPGPDAPALAAFVTLAATCWYTRRSWKRLGRRLGIPGRIGGWPSAWFGPAQGLLGVTVMGLGLWLVLSPAGRGERLGGPLALALLLPGAFLATTAPRVHRRARQAVLALAVLLALELGWWFLNGG
jgi:hypothetical protein